MSSFLKVIDQGLRSLLYTKFGSILELVDVNTGVILYPKEVAFRMVSEKKGTSLSEFISVWRTSTAPSPKRQQTPAARRGFTLPYDVDGTTLYRTVKAVPVDLAYDVYFWSVDVDRLNMIAERYLFWQQDDPNLDLYYNTDYPIDLDLHFGEMVDESNVPGMMDHGNHFCMRVPIKVDGWVFASEDDDGSVIKKIELVMYNNQNLDNYKQCIYETSDYDSDTELALTVGECHIYSILAVNTSLHAFYVKSGNADSVQAGNSKILVADSTGNDGTYTVYSASEETLGGISYTTIIVEEAVLSSVADGSITVNVS